MHRSEHEDTYYCPVCKKFLEFKCPHRDCDVRASCKELALHYRQRHQGTNISYGTMLQVTLNVTNNQMVLVDEFKEKLYLIQNYRVNNNDHVNPGYLVFLTFHGPKTRPGINYELYASSGDSRVGLVSDTMTSAVQGTFLLIPKDFVSPNHEVNLEVFLQAP